MLQLLRWCGFWSDKSSSVCENYQSIRRQQSDVLLCPNFLSSIDSNDNSPMFHYVPKFCLQFKRQQSVALLCAKAVFSFDSTTTVLWWKIASLVLSDNRTPDRQWLFRLVQFAKMAQSNFFLSMPQFLSQQWLRLTDSSVDLNLCFSFSTMMMPSSPTQVLMDASETVPSTTNKSAETLLVSNRSLPIDTS